MSLCSQKLKYRKLGPNKNYSGSFLPLKLSDVVNIMLINVKMPTLVGILIFMSMIHFMLS